MPPETSCPSRSPPPLRRPSPAALSAQPSRPVGRHASCCPGLVEPHAHLDKALTADRVVNARGDLDGAIEVWLPFRETVAVDDIRERARRAALRYLAHGTTLIRTHVDTGPGIGLRAIEALLAVRAELAGLVDIQIVAAASNPVEGPAGAESRALLRAALDAGADLIGGGPWLSDDPAAALDTLLDIAVETGRDLDLHLDETLDPRVLTLPALIERVRGGFPRAITASHCVSLGSQPARSGRPWPRAWRRPASRS